MTVATPVPPANYTSLTDAIQRSMISVLLTNPAYAGQARFGRFATAPWRPPLRPPRGHGPIPRHPCRRFLAPPEQWIDIPVPALIDAALFETTQAQLDENRQSRCWPQQGVRYLLQGLLVCQACGYALCGRWKASLRATGQGLCSDNQDGCGRQSGW